MTVEERLRQTLEQRAATVGTSADAWAGVRRRIDRRRRFRPRLTPAAALAGATLVVVALVAAVLARTSHPGTPRQLATVGSQQPAPTTTLAVAPAAPPTTALTGLPPSAGSAATVGGSGTAGSGIVDYVGVFPDTASELDAAQKAADAGTQRWRLDPRQVAEHYLDEVGVGNASVGDLLPDGTLGGNVPYAAGSGKGNVGVVRLRPGGVWFAVAASTNRLLPFDVHRRVGSTNLAIDVAGTPPASISLEVRTPGAKPWANPTKALGADGTVSFTLTAPNTGPIIVRVVHQAPDGTVGVAERRVAGDEASVAAPPSPTTTAVTTDVLGPGAALRIDGLGPVQVGMTADQAKQAARVAVTTQTAPPCTILSSLSLPGAQFTISGQDGPRIDMIRVTDPRVATLSGIRVGSTEADVMRAYGDRVRARTGPFQNRQLVYTAADPALADLELIFESDGEKVTSMRTGRVATLEMKEPCS